MSFDLIESINNFIESEDLSSDKSEDEESNKSEDDENNKSEDEENKDEESNENEILSENKIIVKDRKITKPKIKKWIVFLEKNQIPVESICFSNCNLKDSSIVIFSKLLMKMKSLEDVDFSKNFLNLSAVLFLQPSVKRLNLANNKIDGSNMLYFLQKFQIKKLIIEELDLENNLLGKNRGATYIASILKKNTTLKRVNLSYNAFCDKNDFETLIEALKINKTITNIDMNCISSKQMSLFGSVLERNDTIQSLKLAKNAISDSIAKTIGESLKKNTSLLDLDLRENLITNKGADFILQALEYNKTIKKIDFQGNPMSLEIIFQVNQKLKSNLLQQQQQSRSLSKVDISNNNNCIDWTELKNIPQNIVYSLKYNKPLQEINFSQYKIGKEEAGFIHKLLKTNDTIQTVCLYDCGINDSCAMEIAQGLKQNKTVSSIDLSKNLINHSAIEFMGENHLKKISFYGNKVDGSTFAFMAQLLESNKTLIELNLSNNLIQDDEGSLAFILEKNATLEKIKFFSNHISKSKIPNLAQALKKNKTLKWIDFCKGDFDQKDIIEIAKALKTNKGLDTIQLAKNSITDTTIKEITNELKDNSSLTWIDLSNNLITDQGIKEIVKMLVTNTTLTDISLQGNEINFNSEIQITTILNANKYHERVIHSLSSVEIESETTNNNNKKRKTIENATNFSLNGKEEKETNNEMQLKNCEKEKIPQNIKDLLGKKVLDQIFNTFSKCEFGKIICEHFGLYAKDGGLKSTMEYPNLWNKDMVQKALSCAIHVKEMDEKEAKLCFDEYVQKWRHEQEEKNVEKENFQTMEIKEKNMTEEMENNNNNNENQNNKKRKNKESNLIKTKKQLENYEKKEIPQGVQDLLGKKVLNQLFETFSKYKFGKIICEHFGLFAKDGGLKKTIKYPNLWDKDIVQKVLSCAIKVKQIDEKEAKACFNEYIHEWRRNNK